jgi:hypothetical protein
LSDATASQKIGLYGKAFSGAVVAALGAYSNALQDGSGITASEWIVIVLAFIASFGIVWSIPLTPAVLATYGKLVFSGLAAAGSSLVQGLIDGNLTQPEVITAVIAFCLASGLTGAVSNAAGSDPVDPTTNRQVAITTSAKRAFVRDNPAAYED